MADKFVQSVHTSDMAKGKKKNNPLQKMGQTIKDTFMEMSESLAGWIDDTGGQFNSEFRKNKQKKNKRSTTQNKTATTKTSSECGTENNCK